MTDGSPYGTISERMVFTYFATRFSASIPEVSSHLGIPSSTVVGLIARLEKRGLITRGEPMSGGRGRPKSAYRLRLPHPVLACKLDGSRVSGAVLDSELAVKAFAERDFETVVWNCWREGDTYLRGCMDQTLDRLGWGLGLVTNLVDPSVVVLGGYVMDGKTEWMTEVIRRSQRWVMKPMTRDTVHRMSTITIEDELRVIGASYFHEAVLQGRHR